MANVNRGRGSGRGRGRGRGVDPEDEERRQQDQRDLEMAAIRERIGELERQLAEARLGSTHEEEESETLDSSEAGNEDEDLNPWGDPNRGRSQGFRPEFDQSYQNFGMKIDIPEFDKDKEPVYDDYGDDNENPPSEDEERLHMVEPVYDDYGDGDENPPSEDEEIQETNIVEELGNNAESLVDIALEEGDEEVDVETNTILIERHEGRLIVQQGDSSDASLQQPQKQTCILTPSVHADFGVPKGLSNPEFNIQLLELGLMVCKAVTREGSVASDNGKRNSLLVTGVLMELYVFDPGVPREVVVTSIIIGGTYPTARILLELHVFDPGARQGARIQEHNLVFGVSLLRYSNADKLMPVDHANMELLFASTNFGGPKLIVGFNPITLIEPPPLPVVKQFSGNAEELDNENEASEAEVLDEEVADSRTNLFLEGENDAGKALLIEEFPRYRLPILADVGLHKMAGSVASQVSHSSLADIGFHLYIGESGSQGRRPANNADIGQSQSSYSGHCRHRPAYKADIGQSQWVGCQTSWLISASVLFQNNITDRHRPVSLADVGELFEMAQK